MEIIRATQSKSVGKFTETDTAITVSTFNDESKKPVIKGRSQSKMFVGGKPKFRGGGGGKIRKNGPLSSSRSI